MSKLVIASNNAHKISEIRAILGDYFTEIVSVRDVGITEDIPETGETFRENALMKASYVFEKTGLATLADDSGLSVDALHGAPGVYSARYAGDHGNDGANNAKMIRELKAMPGCSRDAHFSCCIALLRPGKEPVLAEGICCGVISDEPKGSNGFGYDPYFYIPHMNRTMAELSAEEKNTLSHRAHALEALIDTLRREGR